jgi:hypothetical protein
MSVSNPGEKIEWGADSEPRKNERVPSSVYMYSVNHTGSRQRQVICLIIFLPANERSAPDNIDQLQRR